MFRTRDTQYPASTDSFALEVPHQRQRVRLTPENGPEPRAQHTHHWRPGVPDVHWAAWLVEHCLLRDHPKWAVSVPEDLGHREHTPRHAQESAS